ncbi:prepilin-type N-terminal cleavage/methylation domain-containing protein [Myxococcota bacterium]|nr:prepilin-type N-terminal cleavage/methylation domain-containing protein [Myxococcota bacterium]
MISASKQAGFSLLEVMIAVAILSMGMMVILDSQGGSSLMTVYARDLTSATQLARARMAELIQEIEDGRTNFGLSKSSCKDGDFEKEGKEFRRFTWRYCIKRVEFATPNDIPGLGGSPDDDPEAKAKQASSLMGSLGVPMQNADPSGIAGMLGPFSGMIQSQMKVIFEQLQEALRELEVVVKWQDGKQNQDVRVVTHFFCFDEQTGNPGTCPDKNNQQSTP